MNPQLHTLLLRLDGPMQAWGADSKFGIRETRAEPTKSGIIGLVAAALGRPRTADIGDLAALRFGVRIDRAGVVRRDFHTAGRGGFYRASGKVERGSVIISDRYYLSGACFTAGLEAEGDAGRALLERLHSALLRPRWPLFLGRKAFPPAAPIVLSESVINAPLLEALRRAPLPERHDTTADGRCRFVLDADTALPKDAALAARRHVVAADQPLDFAARRFEPRAATTVHLPLIANT